MKGGSLRTRLGEAREREKSVRHSYAGMDRLHPREPNHFGANEAAMKARQEAEQEASAPMAPGPMNVSPFGGNNP